jgi:hypothetical protein
MSKDKDIISSPHSSSKKRKMPAEVLSEGSIVILHPRKKVCSNACAQPKKCPSSTGTETALLIPRRKGPGPPSTASSANRGSGVQKEKVATPMVRRRKKKKELTTDEQHVSFTKTKQVSKPSTSTSLPPPFMSMPTKSKAADLEICKLHTENHPLMKDWSRMIEGFFRVPESWSPMEYFKGCSLIGLTGVIAGKRVLLGAAATEKLNPEDHEFISIIHAFMIKSDYRGQGLGKEFWIMLGNVEFVEIPICAFVKITEEQSSLISKEYLKFCGEALSVDFLSKITGKDEPSVEQKAEFMNRVIDGGNIDSLQSNIRKHLVASNGAFRFWEKLEFEVTPRVFGREGGDLIIGMSLGFYL